MNGEWRTIFKRNPCETFSHKRKTEGKCSLGKVTISTVLGYKEYVVENIKSILGEDEENSDFRIYPDYHKFLSTDSVIPIICHTYPPLYIPKKS